jgi:hypothetical protein
MHQKGPLALYCSMNCHKGIRGLSAVTAVTTKQNMMTKSMIQIIEM